MYPTVRTTFLVLASPYKVLHVVLAVVAPASTWHFYGLVISV